MLKFFVRFYLGLLVALGLSIVIASKVLDSQYEQILAQENIWLTRALNAQVQQSLQGLPPDLWQASAQQAVADYPFLIELQPVSGLTEHEQQLVTQGVAVRLDLGWFEEHITLFYPLAADPAQVLAYHSTSQLYANYNWLLLVQLLLLLFCIALSVWWLARPLVRHVRKLANVSREIGAGRLAVRADEQAPAPLDTLARDINRMAQQLEQLRQEQEAMTGAVSHELRTPIANLRFALDMTRGMQDVDQLRDQIAEMDQDIDALDELVDELLTYARLRHQRQPGERRPLHLRPLLSQLLDKLGPLQPDLDYQLDCAEEVELQANERDLLRAVSNLLRNAQRYARTQVVIRVVNVAEHLQLSVEDDGPGIPAAERQRVLLPFTRLDESRTRASGGFGLGLAIVQRIVQQHQGQLRVDESPLGGAGFFLQFPR